MVFTNFDELISFVQKSGKKRKVVLAAAHDDHALEAVILADKNNIAEPVLVGDKQKIEELLKHYGVATDKFEIYATEDDISTAKKSVELIREGKADFLMKGKLQTADLLREVVNKETGLSLGRPMTHVGILELPSYHKLVAVTDGGMMTYPDLEGKKSIIENAVEVFNKMGYENPKVAVLAAVEVVNPKMPEAVDGAELKKMNQEGIIKNCVVEGPISYDLAMDKESGEIKGYNSPVAADADILIAPNIATGNILAKSWTFSAGAKLAGFIVGAKVPIVLTSRGSSMEEKYLSLAISALAV